MDVRSELWCHDCDNYVQYTYDDGLNGNHVIKCPKCGHEHCRVIKNGIITSDRWDSRNQNSYVCAQVTYSSISVDISSSSNDTFCSAQWVQQSYYTSGYATTASTTIA